MCVFDDNVLQRPLHTELQNVVGWYFYVKGGSELFHKNVKARTLDQNEPTSIRNVFAEMQCYNRKRCCWYGQKLDDTNKNTTVNSIVILTEISSNVHITPNWSLPPCFLCLGCIRNWLTQIARLRTLEPVERLSSTVRYTTFFTVRILQNLLLPLYRMRLRNVFPR